MILLTKKKFHEQFSSHYLQLLLLNATASAHIPDDPFARQNSVLFYENTFHGWTFIEAHINTNHI